MEGRSSDSWASLYDLLGADVKGTLCCGESTRRGLLHFGDPGRAYAWVLVGQTREEREMSLGQAVPADRPATSDTEVKQSDRDPVADCIREFFRTGWISSVDRDES